MSDNAVYADGTGTVGGGAFNTFVQVVYNIATLRNFTGAVPMACLLEGGTVPGDATAGFYWWNATSTAPDNGSTIIAPYGASVGRWQLLPLSDRTPPGGSNGQVQYNNNGVFGGLTDAQLTARIAQFTASTSGAVPASGGSATTYLDGSGHFTVPAGSGGTAQITNIASLRAATTGTLTTNLVYVQGYYTGADGGEGFFWNKASDVTSADDGGTIIVDASSRRWYRETTICNAKQFGALGNGSTDDTTAIQNMFTAIPSGSFVFFPAGSYLVSSQITISKTLTIFGAGRLSSTLTTNSTTAGILNLNGIADIYHMGFTSTVTKTAGAFITTNVNASRMRIKDCFMTAFFNGIVINGTYDILIDDCEFLAWASLGTAIDYTGGEAFVVSNCVIQQGLRPGDGCGIRFRHGGGQLLNNEIMACGICLDLAPTSGQAVVSVWSVNTAFDNAISGIWIHPTGTGFVGRCWFADFWCSSMDQSGITISSPTLGNVNGIDFLGGHVYDNHVNGFDIQDNRSVCLRFADMQIAGNTASGINFFAGAQNFEITGCRIGPSGGFGANGGAAINLGGICTYYTIADNNLINGGINPLIGAGVGTGVSPGVSEFIRNNQGFVSENSGNATILAGNQFVTVNHGLSQAPSGNRIMITGFSGTFFFVSAPSINATSFQVFIPAILGVPVLFNWTAKIGAAG